MDGSTVAVTGGAGFLGSHLVDRLLTLGCDVIALDSFERGSYDNLPRDHPNLTIKSLDLAAEAELEKHFRGVHFLFDLAGRVSGIGQLHENPADLISTNVGICLNAARAAARANVERVVYASSSCVYDHPAAKVPHVEDDIALPNHSYYGWSKLFAEILYSAYLEQYGLDIGIARIFNAYGPRESLRNPHVIPEFIVKAIECSKDKGTFEILGDGNQTRSFLFVSDAIEGMIRLAEADFSGLVNLGSDKEIKILDLARLVLRVVGVDLSKVSFVHRPVHPKDIRRRAADYSKARSMLGWAPTVPLEQGLKITADWFKGRGITSSHSLGA